MSPSERRARVADLLAGAAREGLAAEQAAAADLDAYVLGFNR